MVASAEVLPLENPEVSGEWTVVLPRRKKLKHFPKLRTPEQQQEAWAPSDTETNPQRESRLLAKLNLCLKILESSQFYNSFMDQIQSQLLDRIFSVLGTEPELQMVIYGIGSIETYETPRLQLSLAMLMKRKFNWIADIEVFDPVLSATESRVMKSLGCSVVSVNEQGRRQALKPTLFFMPHCEAQLYNNLLVANWRPETLNRVVLFGNSFNSYEQHAQMFRNSKIVDSARHVLAIRGFTDEFEVKNTTGDYFEAFHDSSWHFFSLNPDEL